MAEINDTVIPSSFSRRFFVDINNREYEGDVWLLKRTMGTLTAHAISGRHLYSLRVDLDEKSYTIEVSQGDRNERRMVITPSDLAKVEVNITTEETGEKPDIIHVEIRIDTKTDCVDAEFAIKGKKILEEPLSARFYDCDSCVTDEVQFELAAIEFDTV